MIERGRRHRFEAQALPRRVVRGRFGRQQFDRHLAIESGIVGAIDTTHASCADRLQDFIGTEACAGRKRLRWQLGLNLSSNGGRPLLI
jgi:hypothetical protein